MMIKNYQIKKLTPSIGAEIKGLDFTKSLNKSDYDFIYESLIKNQVIFITNQILSPTSHLNLAKSFGEIESSHPVYPHLKDFPEIVLLENNRDNPPDTDVWHTDLTFKPNPPFASILYSLEVPPFGGDTMWANMSDAYETLPQGLKKDIADLRAVHDMSDFRNNYAIGEKDGLAIKVIEAHNKFGSTIHPLVKKHPVTGKPHLYVNPGFTNQIVGMNSTDSRRLLNYLYDHMNQPKFQIRYKWSKNTIAIWDNRCTMHFALADYYPENRKMHRITIINDSRLKN